jgi:ankyrin repeat protein
MFTLSNLKYVACALVIIICISWAMDRPPQGGGWWQSTKNVGHQVGTRLGILQNPIQILTKLLLKYYDNHKANLSNEETTNNIILLLKQYPELANQIIEHDRTLLAWIVPYRIYEPLFQKLISEKIPLNIDFKDTKSKTILMGAALHGNEEIVHYLLSRGVNVDLQDSNGSTALMAAIMGLGIIRGASHHGFEPPSLMQSTINIITMLLDVGANTSLKNNQGQTAFDLAANDPQVLELLNKYKKEKIN